MKKYGLLCCRRGGTTITPSVPLAKTQMKHKQAIDRLEHNGARLQHNEGHGRVMLELFANNVELRAVFAERMVPCMRGSGIRGASWALACGNCNQMLPNDLDNHLDLMRWLARPRCCRDVFTSQGAAPAPLPFQRCL